MILSLVLQSQEGPFPGIDLRSRTSQRRPPITDAAASPGIGASESAADGATGPVRPLGRRTPAPYHQARNPLKIDPHLGAPGVDDTDHLRFFLEPTQTFHRQYEALRAAFVEHRPLDDIAQQFGYSYDALRSLIRDFRARCRAGQPTPFSPPRDAADARGTTPPSPRPPRRGRPSPMHAGSTSLRDAAGARVSPASTCSSRS
jgi:hypothetical protein